MPSARIVMVCTSRTPPAELLSAGARVVREPAELIACPDCDGVIVCTPPLTHAALVREAIAAGKPAMVEKPLCLDPDDARALDADVRRSGVPVLVNHIHLFGAAYEPLRAAIQRHGGVRGIVCEGSGFGPFRVDTPALWDWGAHDVAVALDLVGERPARVEALGCGFPGYPTRGAEVAAIALAFRDDVAAWILTGRASLERRRSTTVFCGSAAFTVVEAAATTTLTEFAIDMSGRYGDPPLPTRPQGRVRLESTDRPLTLAIEHFIAGVRHGPTRYFGAGLAADVVDVLARADRALASRSEAPRR